MPGSDSVRRALWLRGPHLTLSASGGMIALAGIAVLNGVVLLSYIEQLRVTGAGLGDAVREGAAARLRPVLMTALVASVGRAFPHHSPSSDVPRRLG